MLESQQIPCLVKNEHLGSAMGELPMLECWPELWVMHDYDAARAKTLIQEYQNSDLNDDEPAWTCANCMELVDAVFARCWNCQEDKP